jgi:hypothetical protein
MATNAHDDNNSRDESSRSSPSTGTTTRKRAADEDFKLWSRVLERRKRQCANLDVSAVHEILEQQQPQQGGLSSAGEKTSPVELAGLLTSCFEQASDERLPHAVRRTSLEKLQELCSKVEHAVQQQPERPPPTQPPNGHRFFKATTSNELSSDSQRDDVPARRTSSSSSSSPVGGEINATKKRSPSIHIQLPKPTSEKSPGSTSTTPTNGNRPQQDSAPQAAPAPILPGSDRRAGANGRSGTPNASTLLGMLHGTNQTLDFAASATTSRRPIATAAAAATDSSRVEPATSTTSALSGWDPQNRSIAPSSAMNGAAAPSYTRVSGTAHVARNAPVPGRKALSAMETGSFFAAAPTPVPATKTARVGATPTPVPTTNIAQSSTATHERRGSHAAAPTPVSATNVPTSSTVTNDKRGSNGHVSSSASTGEPSSQTAAHPLRATSPKGPPTVPFNTGSATTTIDTGGTARQSQTTLGPPSISTSKSEARFPADAANSQYSGSLEGRNASKVIFRKYSPSYDVYQAMNNRLEKWDPFWSTRRVVVSGMTSPIESLQPPQSQPQLKTVTSIAFELSPDTIHALSPARGNSKNISAGDVRLILRMLPVTWDFKKRADCHLWPKGTFLTIDQVPVQLIQRKQQSHAPTQWYGMCELLDVSSRLLSPSPKRSYSVELCCNDEEQFLFCLSICQYQSAESIVDSLIRDNTPSKWLERLSLEQSIEKAIHRINQEMIVLDSDDENEQQDVGKFVFSLTCPISKRLMQIPVRGKDCKHWQVCYFTPPRHTWKNGT